MNTGQCAIGGDLVQTSSKEWTSYGLSYIDWRHETRDCSFWACFVKLFFSGGHNLLILARDLGQYIQLGTTIDDAIGEAYDKTARWLGLDMRRSGGPAVEELALQGDAESIKFAVS